jgi:AcrR family transcriptional regulator
VPRSRAGVQRIAAEAGVARSSFYVHFPDKAALLVRLTEDLRQKAYELVSRWQRDESADTPESLLTLYRSVVTLYRENQALFTAINEVAAYDPVVREAWANQLGPFVEGTVERLRRDQDRGLAPADLDPVAATRVIVGGGAQAIAQHITDDDGAGDDAFARELALIFWHGAFRRRAAS